MVQAWEIHALDEGLVPADVSAIWKVVTSPRDYRWQVSHSEELSPSLSAHPDRRLQMQRRAGSLGAMGRPIEPIPEQNREAIVRQRFDLSLLPKIRGATEAVGRNSAFPHESYNVAFIVSIDLTQTIASSLRHPAATIDNIQQLKVLKVWRTPRSESRCAKCVSHGCPQCTVCLKAAVIKY
jgi:hypothetical protein